jgi:hypothetical protein
MRVKGLLSVRGVTYRIARVTPGAYEVVRILDELRVGTFECTPALRVMPEAVGSDLLREIAYAAMKQGQLSSTMPMPQVFATPGDPVIR